MVKQKLKNFGKKQDSSSDSIDIQGMKHMIIDLSYSMSILSNTTPTLVNTMMHFKSKI